MKRDDSIKRYRGTTQISVLTQLESLTRTDDFG